MVVVVVIYLCLVQEAGMRVAKVVSIGVCVATSCRRMSRMPRIIAAGAQRDRALVASVNCDRTVDTRSSKEPHA